MRVRIIINPASGRRGRVRAITDAVRRVLAPVEGYFDIKVPTTRAGASLYSARARDLGYDAVFACGGDGTINDVASPLVGSPTSLGVVPSGSGNGFALAMGLPEKIDDALAVVKSWKTRPIDVGTVCSRYFFSTAGVGLDARISWRYNTGPARRRGGILPYVPISLSEYLSWRLRRPEPVVIRMDNSSTTLAPLILTVANTERYGGSAVIAPGALPDDGYLDVTMLTGEGGVGEALRFGASLYLGGLEKVIGYKHFRVQEMEVLRHRSNIVHADGEPFEWGGAVPFGVRHKALTLLVP